MIQNVWLIPAFPLAAFLMNVLFGRRWLKHWTGPIAAAAVGASAIVAIGIFLELRAGAGRAIVPLYTFISVGDLHVNVSALVDPLSSAMALVVPVIPFLLHVYAPAYM